MPTAPKSPACPTCGNQPPDARELQLHREGLETVWLLHDPDQPGRLVERWHCERCQPHQVEIVMCGNTVMLGADLATGSDDQSFQLPELAVPAPPVLTVVLSEAALRRNIGTAETMAGQLAHLLNMTKLSNVEVR